jgi:integrase
MPKVRTHGEGTVAEWVSSKSPNTKYRARKRISLPDGKQKRINAYGPTPKAALTALDAKVERAMLQHPEASTITVKQLVAKLLTQRKAQGRKRSTIQTYAQAYNNHINPAIGSKPFASVTLEDVQEIQNELVLAGKYRTAELAMLVLKSSYALAKKFYRRAILDGSLFFVDPTEDLDPVERPNEKKDPVVIWNATEIHAFLDLSKAEYPERSLYYPLYFTAIASGLRRGELLGLRQDHLQQLVRRTEDGPQELYVIEVDEQLVHHDGERYWDTPKTMHGYRKVTISEECYDVLHEHLDVLRRLGKEHGAGWNPDRLLFPTYNGTSIGPTNLRRSFDNLQRRAGVRRITFHTLRKIYSTYLTRDLIEQGKYPPKILQRLLGHARPDVSMHIYNQVVEDDLDLAIVTLPIAPKKPENSEMGVQDGGTTPNEEDAESVETAS